MDFEKCSVIAKDKLITAEENKRKFIIVNKNGKEIRKVKVDGCLINDQRERCDYLFEIGAPFTRVIYLELKGADVGKAFHQLEATIKACSKRHSGVERCCHIVASRVPKMGPKLQNIKKGFINKNKTPVYLSTTMKKVIVE